MAKKITKQQVGAIKKKQTAPTKQSNVITKKFPVADRPNPQQQKTVDSLKKKGYMPEASSVTRVGDSTKVTFIKKK